MGGGWLRALPWLPSAPAPGDAGGARQRNPVPPSAFWVRRETRAHWPRLRRTGPRAVSGQVAGEGAALILISWGFQMQTSQAGETAFLLDYVSRVSSFYLFNSSSCPSWGGGGAKPSIDLISVLLLDLKENQ